MIVHDVISTSKGIVKVYNKSGHEYLKSGDDFLITMTLEVDYIEAIDNVIYVYVMEVK